MDEDGYTHYFRPHDGQAHQVRGHILDNRWIVPYCPYLSARYDCHINVECAFSFALLKYVNKYIYKGHDRTTMEINKNDEIKLYLDARYVSAIEATWRLFHFVLHHRSPAVIRLQVHLRNRARDERTTLTAFFDANSDSGLSGELARRLTYQEFPRYFRWVKGTRKWVMRKQGDCIGHMYFVSPTAGERFYLRTLLSTVRGPRSFDDLITVNGIKYPTFREACIARGLLVDDGEWKTCLADAIHMQTGSSLRNLFATILMFCALSDPLALWDTFKPQICDDILHQLNTLGRIHPSDEQIYDYGLYLLQQLLLHSGRTLHDFSLPDPKENWGQLVDNHFIAEQLAYDQTSERSSAQQRIQQMNDDQSRAFSEIVQSVERSDGQLFFLNGPGGTGKTFVYNTICNRIRGDGGIVLCLASSGIAALLLSGGRTAHSTFSIPVSDLTAESSCGISKEGRLADMLRCVRLIIWDEISLQHRWAAEAVDRTLRDIRDTNRPFGGITTVFGGDFQQILPVPHGGWEEVVNTCLKRSPLWSSVVILSLHVNMRLEQNPQTLRFSQWLLDIGQGRNLSDSCDVTLPTSMRSPSIDALIQFVYPGIKDAASFPSDYFLNRVILSSRNDDVEDINLQILDLMPGDTQICHSADIITNGNGSHMSPAEIPLEFLRSMRARGLPPGELRLKIGCPLILLRNLSPSQGLCNGTRVTLLRMSRRILEVRIMGGSFDGKIALIPRIAMVPSEKDGEFSFSFQRRQFPVRLAFAMSINKSQGQSVKYVGIDLRVPVFSHGQLYVALSRATSGDRVRVLLPEEQKSCTTKNIVYPEVLD